MKLNRKNLNTVMAVVMFLVIFSMIVALFGSAFLNQAPKP